MDILAKSYPANWNSSRNRDKGVDIFFSKWSNTSKLTKLIKYREIKNKSIYIVLETWIMGEWVHSRRLFFCWLSKVFIICFDFWLRMHKLPHFWIETMLCWSNSRLRGRRQTKLSMNKLLILLGTLIIFILMLEIFLLANLMFVCDGLKLIWPGR